MKNNRNNSKRNNGHLLKEEKQRNYDEMEKIKQDARARKRFEQKPFALVYQEKLEELRKEGREHE